MCFVCLGVFCHVWVVLAWFGRACSPAGSLVESHVWWICVDLAEFEVIWMDFGAHGGRVAAAGSQAGSLSAKSHPCGKYGK